IMHGGRIQQIGDPKALYENPANYFVANFLGKMNFFAGQRRDDGFLLETGQVLPVSTNRDTKKIGLRPENARLARVPKEDAINIAGRILSFSYLGSVIQVKTQLADGAAFYNLTSSRDLEDLGGLEVGSEV